MDFTIDVLQRSRSIPVLVDFWAEWCGPCRTLGPVLERLAEEEAAFAEPRWELVKVDTEAFPEISAQYGVRGIPNVKLFVDGHPVDEFTGALPEHAVRAWIEKALPDPDQEKILEGGRLIATGEMEKGRGVLEEIVVRREHPLAILLLAQSWLEEDPSRADELAAAIGPDSELYDRAESIRLMATIHGIASDPDRLPDGSAKGLMVDGARHAVAGDFDRALELFIDAIRDDRAYADDLARRLCLAIFRRLGEEHEITRKHRKIFNSALY